MSTVSLLQVLTLAVGDTDVAVGLTHPNPRGHDSAAGLHGSTVAPPPTHANPTANGWSEEAVTAAVGARPAGSSPPFSSSPSGPGKTNTEVRFPAPLTSDGGRGEAGGRGELLGRLSNNVRPPSLRPSVVTRRPTARRRRPAVTHPPSSAVPPEKDVSTEDAMGEMGPNGEENREDMTAGAAGRAGEPPAPPSPELDAPEPRDSELTRPSNSCCSNEPRRCDASDTTTVIRIHIMQVQGGPRVPQYLNTTRHVPCHVLADVRRGGRASRRPGRPN